MAARRPATASGVALWPSTTSATSPGSIVVATNTATDTNRSVPRAISTRQPINRQSGAMGGGAGDQASSQILSAKL